MNGRAALSSGSIASDVTEGAGYVAAILIIAVPSS